jgi:hypothetical protein
MHHTLLRVRKLHRVEGSGSNAGTRHLSPQQTFRYRVSIVYFKIPDHDFDSAVVQGAARDSRYLRSGETVA